MRSEHFAHPISEFENAFGEWIRLGFVDLVGHIVPEIIPPSLCGVDVSEPTRERSGDINHLR
jgi:hypothetical protein